MYLVSLKTLKDEGMRPMAKGFELKIFISSRESECGECGENLGRRAWIMLNEKELYLKVVFKGKGGVSTGRLLAAVNRPH